MNFVTLGKKIHKEMVVDLCPVEDHLLAPTCESSLRAVLVDQGSIVLDQQGNRLFVEAPAILCMDKKVTINLVKASKQNFPTIHFKPQVINSLFSYSFIETMDYNTLSQTERQDFLWLLPFLSEESQGFTYVKLGPDSIQRAMTLFHAMHRELDLQPDGFWPCRSRSIFLEFLYYLTSIIGEYEDFKHEQKTSGSLFEDIQFYLHTHFHENLTLEELANKFNTNRTSLNSLFVESTGKTVIAYLISLRIKLACLILRDTTVPIKEIVFRTGFNDLTHFGRTFKKHLSQTPSQYRENFNWMLK